MGTKSFIEDSGVWGPIIYIMIYSFRSLVFFPASLLTAMAGLLFGPLIGIFSSVVGENISANISFMLVILFLIIGWGLSKIFRTKNAIFNFKPAKREYHEKIA